MRFSRLFLRRGGASPPSRVCVGGSPPSVAVEFSSFTPTQNPVPNRGRSKPAPLRGPLVRSNFGGEKYAANSRLELMRILCFVWVTAVTSSFRRAESSARTRRSASRLEFWAFEGRGIIGWRSANCGPNREMLPLPAFVPGGFICSSSRLGAASCGFDQDAWAAWMGRPRAGIASDCVIILRLLCGCVNGTERLGSRLSTKTSAPGAKSPPHKRG